MAFPSCFAHFGCDEVEWIYSYCVLISLHIPAFPRFPCSRAALLGVSIFFARGECLPLLGVSVSPLQRALITMLHHSSFVSSMGALHGALSLSDLRTLRAASPIPA
jgi:hypothetical protein